MKREIKFRAWDGLEMISMAINESLDSFFLHVQIKADIFDKKCELMQFIGLIDKNGKEIYEGDVAQLNEEFQDESSVSWIGQIAFHSGCFWFEADGRSENCWFQHNEQDIEVIGNIYENPELLK